MKKRKVYQVKENGGFHSPAMTKMRDTVYSPAADVALFQQNERSDRMRNDQELIAKAEAKRKRKLAKFSTQELKP